MNEITKQLEARNLNHIIPWIEKRLSAEETKPDLGTIEHILDWIESEKPAKLEKMTFKEALTNAEKWVQKMNKQGEHIKESKKDTEVVLDFKDGFKFVKLVGKNAYEREGFLMSHCVAGYFGKDDEIYSLRDKKNQPHATLSKSSQQIKGKGNGSIHPNYIRYVVEFLEFLKIEVRDSEMKNLGYVNIEEIKDKNAVFPDLFRKKYFYEENIGKIVNKNGDKYENITLWNAFGLFKFSADLKVNFNFSIEKCVETFRSLFKKESDKETQAGGNYAKMAGGENAEMTGGENAKMTGGENAEMTGGYNAKMDLQGRNTIAIAGKGARMKGVIGSWLVLTEYDSDWNIINVHPFQVDGVKVKEGIWYTLNGSALTEVKE